MNTLKIPSRLVLAVALWRMRWKLGLRGARVLKAPNRGPLGACTPAHACELALAIEQAAVFVPGSRCLDRSLLLQQLVGASAVLRLGVRRVAGTVSAHAWIEVDGAVVNDDPAAVAAFVPLEGVTAAANMLPYD